MTPPNDDWLFTHSGDTRVRFDWMASTRRAASVLVPFVLARLKAAAPVSQVKPDAGRFRDSIGFRIESALGVVKLLFVSTSPYASYVINPTEGGAIIRPTQTQALRIPITISQYVFAGTVTRGMTRGNDFNVRIADQITPLVMDVFDKSFTTISTA